MRNSIGTVKNVVESKFSHSDRTLFGVPYPIGSHLTDREPDHHAYLEWIE